MFKTDRPIGDSGSDCLGRAAFSARLASALGNLALDDSVVVGLSGPWGSGKTSLINLVLQEMGDRGDDFSPMMVAWFNPWNSIGDEGMVESFFQSIIQCLKQNPAIPISQIRAKQELLEDISEYADALKPGWQKATLRTVARKAATHAQRKENSISYLKKKIGDKLKDFNLRILVVIDDLDRLSQEQICLTFQLVAAIADFPSVSYLLAYDRSVVESALKEVQKTDGAKYLEKIIQVPIDLPEPNPGAIRTLLSKELKVIHAYIDGGEKRQDPSRRLGEFQELVAARVETVRNLKRYINALSFELSGCAESVDPVDLAAIAYLRTFHPDVINWIKSREAFLCLSGDLSDLVQGCQKKDSDVVSDMEEYGVVNAANAFGFVRHLFMDPRRVGMEGEFTLGDYRARKRLVCKEVFDAYLCGSSDAVNPIFDSVYRGILSKDNNVARNIIAHYGSRERYSEIIESFLALKRDISFEMAPNVIGDFARAIFFADYSDPYYSENSKTVDLIYYLAPKMEGNFPSLCETLFAEIDDRSVVYLAELVVRQERVHSRNGFEGGHGYPKLFDLEILEKIEKRYIEAASRCVESKEMIGWDGLSIPLALWRNIDRSSFTSVLLEALSESPLVVALYAQAFTYSWQSHSATRGFTRGWSVSEEIEEHLDRNVLLLKISEALSSDGFWHLPKTIQYRIIAFEDGVKRRDYSLGSDAIDETEINKRLMEMRGR